MSVTPLNTSSDFSGAEWQARVELAALFRISGSIGSSIATLANRVMTGGQMGIAL